METPVVSGSEILSNPGNAGLGYSSGVNYGANPADQNVLAPVNSTISRLQEEESQLQVMRYQRRVKQQEELSQMLANTGGSLFNVAGPGGQNLSFTPLPEDKKILDEKVDKIRKAVISDPQGYQYNPDILRDQQELNALKNHASIRSKFHTESNMEAAKSNDSQERQEILANNKQEVADHSLTDFHTPTPHLNKLTSDINNFYPKEIFTKESYVPLKVKVATDKGGNEIEYNVMGHPNDKLDIRSQILPGTKAYNDGYNLLQNYAASPLSKDPNQVLHDNQAIDQINQERGWADAAGNVVDKHAIPHMAEVGPDGMINWNHNLTLQDRVYSLLAPQVAATTLEPKLKKDAAELAKEKEGIKNTESEIQDRKVKNAHAAAQLGETIRHNKAEEDIARAKNDPDLAEANNAANTVLGHMAETIKDGKFVPLATAIKTLPSFQADALRKTAADKGIDLSKYSVAHVDPNDEVVQSIAGIQHMDETGKYAKGVDRPEYAYYLRSNTGNTADDKYIIGYSTTKPSIDDKGVQKIGKNNKPQLEQSIEWKATTPQEAAGNVIKSRKNFDNITDKTTDNIGRAANKVAEALSGTPSKEPAQGTTPTAIPPAISKDIPKPVKKIGAATKTSTLNGKQYWKVNDQWVDENGTPVATK